MVDYLLGLLDETTAAEIDERIVLDHDFYETVLEIEKELLGKFVTGELTDEQKARIQRVYSATRHKRIKLDSAKALYSIAKARPEAEKNPFSEQRSAAARIREFFAAYRKILIPAGVAVGLVLVLVLVMTKDRENPVETEIAALNRESADGTIKPPPGKTVRELSLRSNIYRGSDELMPKLEIASDDEIIALKLGLVDLKSPTFKATIFDDQGNRLFSVSSLQPHPAPGGPHILILIPARLIKSGDYQAVLNGQSKAGENVESGSYAFRIMK